MLDADEEVLSLASARSRQRRGVLAVTNRRVLFVHRHWLLRRAESFGYEALDRVQAAPGILTLGSSLEDAPRSFDVVPGARAMELASLARTRIQGRDSGINRLLAEIESHSDAVVAGSAGAGKEITVDGRPPSDGTEVVLAWRRHRLVEAGFDDVDAARLASEPELDVARATELITRGCPADLAERILL